MAVKVAILAVALAPRMARIGRWRSRRVPTSMPSSAPRPGARSAAGRSQAVARRRARRRSAFGTVYAASQSLRAHRSPWPRSSRRGPASGRRPSCRSRARTIRSPRPSGAHRRRLAGRSAARASARADRPVAVPVTDAEAGPVLDGPLPEGRLRRRVPRHLVPARGDADLDEHHGRGRRHDPGHPAAPVRLHPLARPGARRRGRARGLGRGPDPARLRQLRGRHPAVDQGRDPGRRPPDPADEPAGRAHGLARRPFLGHVGLQRHGRPGADRRLHGDRGPDRGRLVPAAVVDLGLFAVAGLARTRSSDLSEDYLPWKRPLGTYPKKTGNFVMVIPVE